MLAEACQVNVKSFNLAQSITFKKLFSKVDLSPSARLIIHCLVAHWNPQKGLVFPRQTTIMEETGIKSDKSITESIKELKEKKLILTTKKGTKLNYHFTNIFFDLVEITGNDSKNYDNKPVKITGTCHEQKREQKNNKILNFSKNEVPGYLKDKDHARAILASYNKYNLKPNAIEIIKQIQEHWNFNINDFDILIYLSE